jgi:hypothetical protein
LKAIRVTIIILLSCSFLEASDALDGNLRKELFALNYNSEIAGELSAIPILEKDKSS